MGVKWMEIRREKGIQDAQWRNGAQRANVGLRLMVE